MKYDNNNQDAKIGFAVDLYNETTKSMINKDYIVGNIKTKTVPSGGDGGQGGGGGGGPNGTPGGGGSGAPPNGATGDANTGGGGGGERSSGPGAAGGSGIVILRYPV